jgi:hypothetical protein
MRLSQRLNAETPGGSEWGDMEVLPVWAYLFILVLDLCKIEGILMH